MKYLYIFIILFLLSLAQGCDDYKSDDGLPLPVIDNSGFANTNITHDTPKLNKPVYFSAKEGSSFSWDIIGADGASVLKGEANTDKEFIHTFTQGGEWTVILRSDRGESKGVINIPNDNNDIDYSIDLAEEHSVIGDLAGNNLYLYGSNAKGKLCADEKLYDKISEPRLLVSFRDLNSVAAGDNHTLFVSSHRAWGCGDNSYGQLGLGRNVSGSSGEPIHITDIKYGSFIKLWVAAGGDKSTAIIVSTQSGSGILSKVYSFGAEESRDNPTYIPRELVVPNVAGRSCPIQAVGREHALFRATWAFNMFSGGWNKKGQLGRAANRTPGGYTGLSTPDELIVDPAAWGYSNYTAYIYAPYGEGYDPKYDNVTGGTSNITYFENNNCDARLAAGDYFSMAVKRTGSSGYDALYIWGDNSEGQLGLSVVNSDKIIRRPAPLFNNLPDNAEKYRNSMSHYISSEPISDKITEIAAGRAHGLAVSERGELYAWGANAKGQLTNTGTPNAVNNNVKTIPAPKGSGKWLNVWAGGDRTIALADDYNLYTWGDNKDGILGAGKSGDFIETPVKLYFDIRPVN